MSTPIDSELTATESVVVPAVPSNRSSRRVIEPAERSPKCCSD